MNNAKVAEHFELMALLLELEGSNPFRIRSYDRAAQTIGGLASPLKGMPREQLLEVPGIGKGIADHIEELLRTGALQELEDLRKKYPPGVLDMTQVEGLGPKRTKLLFERFKIDSPEKLKAAAAAGRLRELPGFGAKLEEKILRNLAFSQEASKRIHYWQAKLLAEELTAALRGFPGVKEVAVAGSLRRCRETVGDLDILCTAARGSKTAERFVELPQVERVIVQGPTKASVWLRDQVQCDLRVVAPESFGAALLYFTGSKDHNVALRERALKKGLSVNEYGVFRISDRKHERPLAGRTEAEVYEKLGLEWIPPELRENRGELEAAAAGKLPKLVELKDVRGDFHNHSNYTDGSNTLEEMARAAQKRGWEWVALGDHSQSLRVAGGLSVQDLRKTIAEVRRLGERMKGIKLMRSMEVDVLRDGKMDYPDDVLNEIDVVVASVHSHFTQSEEEMTRRIQRAARHPGVDVIGHLSGRRIGRREAYRYDAEAIFKTAAESGAAFELNGQPERQDLNDVFARRAKELGAALTLDTDAHSCEQFAYMELAVAIARRAWLEKKDLVNCLSYGELQAWLKRPRS